jgi:sec-independent protein translocase protein TatC
MSGQKMTLLQHFAELRRRALWCLLWFAGGFAAGWAAAPAAQRFLSAPLLDAWGGTGGAGTMLYTGLADGLLIQFSLATLFALLVTLPAVLLHAWAFVSPGLRPAEKKFIAPILAMSPALFLLGAAFAYFILFPVAFKFFLELNESAPVPSAFLPAAGNYLSFVIGMLKVFGVAFQLPLVLILLNRIGVLPRAAVVRYRRYALVGIFVVSAVLTPPDVVSQCMLAVPLWGLFEASILFMKKERPAE